ncbi:unnamed protein product [Candidula unifasciata]|uniref:Major facilitator superfamily domain-containing protein 12 n=1 Tax=Candidula unifasciata TaxID=100452 RepID=A0A8S3ZZB5_9EUPU|nr:unnamed protein product [Candidula unifasciata]
MYCIHSQLNRARFSPYIYGIFHPSHLDVIFPQFFSVLLLLLLAPLNVNNFENVLAGNLILIGQVSDAIFTPFIGYESDRSRGIEKIGKRKTWHLVGTLCVMASFPFLFTKCITCSHAPNIAQFIYYAPFVVIFQFGWAATQISHLSFSSDFTPHRHERVTLQSIRNMFTVVANLSVYGIFAALFYLAGRDDATDGDLGIHDAPKFQMLAFICIGLGTVFNFIFHLGTKEKPHSSETETQNRNQVGENSIERSTLLHSRMTWKDWLKEPQFYQIAVLYMATRLYINVSQVYFPMYLTETINLSKESIAILPLVTYCSSFVMSFAASFINRLMGRKLSYVLAAAIGVGSCVWMYFVPKNSDTIYGCAFLMGASGSLLLITSLSMTSDLISANTESGAFVFGAMSFTDKLSNGIAVLLIQRFHPCNGCCPACTPYYRNVQVFIPGASLVVGFLALLTLIPQNIGARSRAVDVLENPARASQNSSTNSLRCSCGTFYTSSNECPTCGAPHYNHANGSVIHSAEVHRHYDTNDSSDDEALQKQEKRSLLRSSINTPSKDVQIVSEYGSLRNV